MIQDKGGAVRDRLAEADQAVRGRGSKEHRRDYLMKLTTKNVVAYATDDKYQKLMGPGEN